MVEWNVDPSRLLPNRNGFWTLVVDLPKSYLQNKWLSLDVAWAIQLTPLNLQLKPTNQAGRLPLSNYATDRFQSRIFFAAV